MHGVDTIIWDWNGTLLNDVDMCIESINFLLQERNLKPLSRKQYRDIFTFPVRNYYEIAGFDFERESWDQVAHEFMDLYFSKLDKAAVFPDASMVLDSFQQRGFRQFMVSAMKHESLISSVKGKGLYGYFEDISGIQDHFASSKVDMAGRFVREKKLNLKKTCLIGDSIHDHEVAEELGICCLLVAHGHQSFERLKETGCEVIHDLQETLKSFRINNIDTPYTK
jgi:phosphoglycolate phosphatase